MYRIINPLPRDDENNNDFYQQENPYENMLQQRVTAGSTSDRITLPNEIQPNTMNVYNTDQMRPNGGTNGSPVYYPLPPTQSKYIPSESYNNFLHTLTCKDFYLHSVDCPLCQNFHNRDHKLYYTIIGILILIIIYLLFNKHKKASTLIL